MDTLYINTDGGSRGNPGPAGIGVVFCDGEGNLIHSHKEFIGHATNNQAEYKAIVKALDALSKSTWFSKNNNQDCKVICRLDSKLVVEQINGNYKVKNEGISILLDKLNTIKQDMKIGLSFVHIPREENKMADKLVNEALDQALKK